jgi:hypothetical protein
MPLGQNDGRIFVIKGSFIAALRLINRNSGADDGFADPNIIRVEFSYDELALTNRFSSI